MEKELRIRELTMRYGLSYPSDEELIMLILGSGTKNCPVRELSRQVLCMTMASNSDNLIENLLRIKGMGVGKALMIASALEFGKRLNRNPELSLTRPAEIIPYIQSYAMQKQEHLLCVTLNGANEIISIRVVCIGSGNMAAVHPAEVFEQAIKEHASAIVICHNHPSQNPTPSDADISTTLRIFEAAEVLGISLLDHIIIKKTSYYSFLEHNLLNEEKLRNRT